jgi:hypothetical protein
VARESVTSDGADAVEDVEDTGGVAEISGDCAK